MNVFIALSSFSISNDMVHEVKTAFLQRPHLVDSAPGFLGMEIMNSVDNPAEITLLTRWSDEQSYHCWHRSHAYHDSHKGIPKGLKLVLGSTEVRFFEVFAN
jgi:heme-degrading monooxygenase HmoA